MARSARPTRTVLAALGVAAALTVAGCTSVVEAAGTYAGSGPGGGGGSTSQAPKSSEAPASSEAPESSEAAPSSDAGGSDDSGGPVSPDGLPADFPIPPDAEAQYSKTLLSLKDPEAAYDFWLDALPKAGYTIINSQKVGSGEGFYALIDFTGKGANDASIAIAGTTAAIKYE